MAIQKKSLISNRTATKKALVAKPEVSNKPGVTRLKATKVAVDVTRLRGFTRLRGVE